MFGSSQRVRVDSALERIAAGAVVVDVRSRQEWDRGHVPRSVHRPVASGPDPKLDPATPIVLVCRSGSRSKRAAKVWRRAGYAAVDLAGGLLAWQAAGQDLTAGRGKPGRV